MISEKKQDEKEVEASLAKTPAELLAEILETNKQILESASFLHRYFKWQMIWSSIKWTIFVIIIVLGFFSLRAAASYLQSYGDVFKSYSQQLQGVDKQTESLKNLIKLK